MRQFLTVREAGEILGKHPATIRRWIKQGRLSGEKVGGKYGLWLLPKTQILELKVKDLEEKVRSQGLFGNMD